MTDKQIQRVRDTLPKWENGKPPVYTLEQKNTSRELDCREMINSILCYHGIDGLRLDSYWANRYLTKYISELGKDTVIRLCDEQIADFKKAVLLKNVHVDSEGVSYNSVYWGDDMLEEVVLLAKAELNEHGSIGYTTPDHQHHIYIYVDDSITHADESKTVEDGYYVVEPNRLVDGACEPISDPVVVEYNDFEGLRNASEWCLSEFAHDRESGKGMSRVDVLLQNARERSESADISQATKTDQDLNLN